MSIIDQILQQSTLMLESHKQLMEVFAQLSADRGLGSDDWGKDQPHDHGLGNNDWGDRPSMGPEGDPSMEGINGNDDNDGTNARTLASSIYGYDMDEEEDLNGEEDRWELGKPFPYQLMFAYEDLDANDPAYNEGKENGLPFPVVVRQYPAQDKMIASWDEE